MSETVTDGLRALLLELAGYEVNVFEFIGGEHTAKNCMITAIRKQRTTVSSNSDDVRSRLRHLAGQYGVRQQRLAQWMGERLTIDDDDDEASTNKYTYTSTGMPPL